MLVDFIELWYTDWNLISLRDLHAALHANTFMETLEKTHSLANLLYHELQKLRLTLPLFTRNVHNSTIEIIDTQECSIPVQELLPAHPPETLARIGNPWLPRIAERTNTGYALKQHATLCQTYSRT